MQAESKLVKSKGLWRKIISKKKEDILIFGTGEAGKAAFHRLKKTCNVIGFLDNNKSKVGSLLYKKNIYSPVELGQLSYDRIVIASMYHPEIMAQLVGELKVPVDKITIAVAENNKNTVLTRLASRLIPKSPEYFRLLKMNPAFRLSCLAAHYYHSEPLLENHVLYESSNGRDFAGNPYALFRYLLEHKDYQHLNHVIAVNDINHPKLAPFKGHPRVQIVEMNSDLFVRYAESCKYYINDVSFKPYLIKKEGQVYVYTWHSTLLKKLAADSNYVWEAKNTSRALLATDYFISPNRYTTENLCRCLGVDSLMPGLIAEIGYPRNDLIFNTDREQIRKRLNIPKGKKVILFAPTWRGQYYAKNTVKETLDYYWKIKENISDDYVIVVKFHTMVYPYLDKEAWTLSVPQDIDTNELLAVTDLLITDYSGILFDYLITGNPMIFFTPDRQEYAAAKSGFYLDLNELPGPICDTIEEVIDKINGIEEVQQQYAAQYRKFQERFVSAEDGRACERVINLVFKGENYENVYRLENKKKNILIYPGNLATNGVTTSFLTLLDYLDYDKYNIIVLLPNDYSNRQNQQRINKKAKVFYQVTTDGFTRREYVKAERLKILGLRKEEPELTTAYRRNMRRIFTDLEFDTVINFNGYSASWAAKLYFGLKAKKKVIYLHNDLNKDRKIKNPGLHSVFSLYRFYDKLFCVSEDSLDANARGMGAYTKRMFGFDPVPKMDYVNNLIKPERIIENAEKLQTTIENGKEYYLAVNPISSDPSLSYSFTFPLPTKENINFITIGRLSPEKNHLRLLKAFYQVQKEYSNVRLYIVGQGVMKSELISFTKERMLDDKVVFIDYLANPYPLLKLCDCFVLSSDIEGQGLVILEALVMGKYVISTDIPGPHNILKNGEGQLVPCSDEALAEAMLNFVKNGKNVGRRKFDSIAYVANAIKQFQEKVL